jgi:hypothetical protein
VTGLRVAALIAVWPLFTLGAGAPAFASEQPVVVELFTSQGCSSCPPANANLIRLAQRKDVLTLSYSVTYWDRLGWKDVFGKPEFTERQVVYEPPLGERGPFTPQMVVNGRLSAVGHRLDEVEGLIASASADKGPDISLTADKVRIGAGRAPAGGADVWLVRFDPNTVEVPVARGENGGRTLAHTHVVHDLRRLGAWDGSPVSLALTAGKGRLSSAVLVQARQGGPILAAAR